MSIVQVRVVSVGGLYVLIFLSGIWLSRSGAPYSTLMLAMHKLITLAAIIFFGRTMYHIHQATRLSTVEFAAVVITIVLLLGTIITGALLSAGKTMPAIVLTLHKITPFFTVLSTTITFYLLLNRPHAG